MAKGLHVTITGPKITRSLSFRTFPVRFGRDPECECPLAFWFASRQHARLDLQGDDLVLFDAGSKHGTFVADHCQRVSSSVRLQEFGGKFQIGTLTFHAALIDLDRAGADGPAPTRNAPASSAEAAPALTRTYAQHAVDPARVDARAAVDMLRAELTAGRGRLREQALAGLRALEPTQRATALRELAGTFPELVEQPEIADRRAATVNPQAAASAHAALVALLEQYLPGAGPLDEPDRVEAAVRRLDAAFRALLEGASSMMYVYACEADGVAFGGAMPTQELGATLLDEKRSEYGRADLEQVFLAMVTQHARLEREAVAAVHGVLEELSPQAFRSFGHWPFRAAARWTAYEQRHKDLAKMDGATIARLFGPTFARVHCALARTPRQVPAPLAEDDVEPPERQNFAFAARQVT